MEYASGLIKLKTGGELKHEEGREFGILQDVLSAQDEDGAGDPFGGN